LKLEYIEEIRSNIWDKTISQFDTKFLFHQSAWLKFLEETQPGKVLRFRIVDGGMTMGYFVGLLLEKRNIKILGSPLPGWTTDYMGPIVNKGFDYKSFIYSLVNTCRNFGIQHIELNNPFLDKGIMQEMHFHYHEGITYLTPLFKDENLMWDNLKSNCRNRIRKAQKNELIVEDCIDPIFINEYYDQLNEVFKHKNLVPTYSIQRVESLFKNLKPDLLFTLRVKHNDKIIATGIFPHDDRCIYFFGGASWKEYQSLCPNEILHWTAMTRAAKLGIETYNMCGGGSFKPKFGGLKVQEYNYWRSFTIRARFGRQAYRYIFYTKQKLKGIIKNFL